MSSPIRHFIALLLLVLLPLQAMAAVVASASAPLVVCSDEMMAMGCCEGDGIDGAGCQAASCFAVAAVAPPLTPGVTLPALPTIAPAPAMTTLHESHISDGPQRPPRPHS